MIARATKITVVIWFRATAGKIIPLMFAPGNVNASMWKPGKKFIRANRNAMFNIEEIIPKVRILMGKNTNENIGLMASVINHKPAITRGRFLGFSPTEMAGIKFAVVKKDAIVIKRDFM